ncbi:unnamed protein product, partial [Ascophyllum nodosum]
QEDTACCSGDDHCEQQQTANHTDRQARTDGSAWSRPRERKSEENRARRASSRSGGSFSTENCVKFVVLFNIIADGFPCFHG